MSTVEPLTPEQLAEIQFFAQAVTVAWGSRTPDLSDFLSTAAYSGAMVAREHVPVLLAEVEHLQARIVELARCAPAENTLIRCWINDHGDPCEWSEETRRSLANTIANCRAAGAL